MAIDDNPFERWNLDPGADRRELTKALRQRIADVDDPDERQELQEQWRSLTTDAMAQGRWLLLTPPPLAAIDDPWEAARQLLSPRPAPPLPPLEPTLDDALIVPLIDGSPRPTDPPFLPRQIAAESTRHRSFSSPDEDGLS